VEQKLFSSSSTDFLADACEGNAFAGIQLGGSLVQTRKQSLLFRFRDDRFFLRLQSGSER
jgi:hypothetical protein